jgi:hypothetical protein
MTDLFDVERRADRPLARIDGPALAPHHRTGEQAPRGREISQAPRRRRSSRRSPGGRIRRWLVGAEGRQRGVAGVGLEGPMVPDHRRAQVKPRPRQERRRADILTVTAVTTARRVERVDAPEAAERAACAIEVPVAVAVPRGHRRPAELIALDPRLEHRHVRRQPRRPRRALRRVAQVVLRRVAPRQLGPPTAAVVDRHQRAGRRGRRQRQVPHRVGLPRRGRGHDQGRPTVAGHVGHKRRLAVVPPAHERAPRAQRSPAEVRVVPHLLVVEVQQIRGPGAVQIHQPHPRAVVPRHPRRAVHHHPRPEPPVAQRRPVLHRPRPHPHQIWQPVAVHVREVQILPRVGPAARRRLGALRQRHDHRRPELRRHLVEGAAGRREPHQRVAARDHRVGPPIAVQIDPERAAGEPLELRPRRERSEPVPSPLLAHQRERPRLPPAGHRQLGVAVAIDVGQRDAAPQVRLRRHRRRGGEPRPALVGLVQPTALTAVQDPRQALAVQIDQLGPRRREARPGRRRRSQVIVGARRRVAERQRRRRRPRAVAVADPRDRREPRPRRRVVIAELEGRDRHRRRPQRRALVKAHQPSHPSVRRDREAVPTRAVAVEPRRPRAIRRRRRQPIAAVAVVDDQPEGPRRRRRLARQHRRRQRHRAGVAVADRPQVALARHRSPRLPRLPAIDPPRVLRLVLVPGGVARRVDPHLGQPRRDPRRLVGIRDPPRRPRPRAVDRHHVRFVAAPVVDRAGRERGPALDPHPREPRPRPQHRHAVAVLDPPPRRAAVVEPRDQRRPAQRHAIAAIPPRQPLARVHRHRRQPLEGPAAPDHRRPAAAAAHQRQGRRQRARRHLRSHRRHRHAHRRCAPRLVDRDLVCHLRDRGRVTLRRHRHEPTCL